MTIYIGNVHYSCSEAQLFDLLAPYGNISDLNYPVDQVTRSHRGFAFATVPDREVAEEAIRKLDGTVLEGRPLRVTAAKSPDRPDKGIPVGFRKQGENPFGGGFGRRR